MESRMSESNVISLADYTNIAPRQKHSKGMAIPPATIDTSTAKALGEAIERVGRLLEDLEKPISESRLRAAQILFTDYTADTVIEQVGIATDEEITSDKSHYTALLERGANLLIEAGYTSTKKATEP